MILKQLHHGLRTDAATHFEKSVDVNMVLPALKRAIALIQELANGSVASNIIDTYPNPLAVKETIVTFEYIDKLSGKKYEKDAVINILNALGFTIKEATDTQLLVAIPSDKNDVHQAADLVEEIIRIDGLDNVAIKEDLNIALQNRKAPQSRKWKEKIAQQLSGLGFSEILTNSIVNIILTTRNWFIC